MLFRRIAMKDKENDVFVSKEMKTSDVMDKFPVAREVFSEYGMLCMDCSFSDEETVEESCRVHAMDPEAVIAFLNEKIAEEGQN